MATIRQTIVRGLSKGRDDILTHSRGVTLTHKLVEIIGQAVVSGRYPENDAPFTEADLRKHFGAGRGSIREVVFALTYKGIFGALSRRGMWVRPEEEWNLLDPDILRWIPERNPSLSLLKELTELRLGIEPVAAGFAARRATGQRRADIATAIARVVAAQRGEDDIVSSHVAFRTSIIRASENRFYAQLITLIATTLRLSLHRMGNSDRIEITKGLKVVAAAVLVSDVSSAETAMRKLIQYELAQFRSKDAPCVIDTAMVPANAPPSIYTELAETKNATRDNFTVC